MSQLLLSQNRNKSILQFGLEWLLNEKKSQKQADGIRQGFLIMGGSMDQLLDIKLTFVKKCGFFVFLVILGVFFCIDTPWARERSRKRDVERWISWDGWITITHERKVKQRMESRTRGVLGDGHYDENLKAMVRAEACCCGYSRGVITTIDYVNHNHTIDGKAYQQSKGTQCNDERSRPYKVMQPGDAVRKKFDASEHYRPDPPGEGRVTLKLKPDGKYELSANIFYYIDIEYEDADEWEFACSGEKRVGKLSLRSTPTGMHGELYSSNPFQMKSGDSPELRKHFMTFRYEGTFTGDVIKGVAFIPNPDPGKWGCLPVDRLHTTEFNAHDEIVGEYEFKLKDGCSEVIDKLMDEAAYVLAWKDPSLKEKAFDIELEEGLHNRLSKINHYTDLVDDYARTIRLKRRPPEGRPGGGQKSIDISTDFRKCEIEKKREFLEQQKKICQPKVLVDSVLKHENTHVSQCEHYRDNYPARYRMDPLFAYYNVNMLAGDEVEATCAGMRVLINWLEDRPWCNFDTRPYRQLCEPSSR